MLESEACRAFFSRALGPDLGPSAMEIRAEGAPSDSVLTPAERGLWSAWSLPARRDEWLRGRVALKSVLRRLGEDEDTARIRFPHPRLSLTHCGTVAVAVGARTPGPRGIGVDLEIDRTPPASAARFFLSPFEGAAVDAGTAAERPRALRRLWTVKEALYKADPRNRGRMLADYRVTRPREPVGTAVIAGAEGEGTLRYAVMEGTAWSLAVAVFHAGAAGGNRMSPVRSAGDRCLAELEEELRP